MGGITFNPDKDIPDLSGKVIFVTGGTAGLGKISILALAKHAPEHIYFSGRDSKKAAAVISEVKAAAPSVNVTFIECDHTSLASVNEAAKRITSETQRLDVLMCNAGVMAETPALTKDGYELVFGLNHLSHGLFVQLLLPTLLRTAEEAGSSDVRIVFVSSMGWKLHPKGGILFEGLRTTQANIGPVGPASAWMRYGQSKLANILYAAELARRYPSITSVSIHPGVVATDLVSNLSWWNRAFLYITSSVVTPEDGTLTQLWAATGEKETMVNGAYYDPIAVLGTLDDDGKSEKLAGELWEWTQKELEGYGS